MNIAIALTDGKIDSCDGEILMGYILGKDRSWIIAHGEYALTLKEEQRWSTYRKRREQNEPVAYIIGEKEFFGRSFYVDSSVLIPRPSTEGLVEMVLEILNMVRGSHLTMTHQLDSNIIGISEMWGPPSEIHTIVDIGTGSGCIAVTLACELPNINVIALDISAAALDMAKKNAERHGVGERICFLQGNLLEPLCHPTPFLLVSNPPYIPEREELPMDVRAYEPSRALHAGPDGLAILRPLLAAAHAHPACKGYVIECRADQKNALGKFDEKATYGENVLL